MQSNHKISELPDRHIVLLGVGHTNAHIVRMWANNPVAGTSLTCVSDGSAATYSGLLPAVLSGQQPEQDMQIDLVRLCASAGARLITDEVTAVDMKLRQLRFKSRPAIRFDALSVGVGSVPTTAGVELADSAPLVAIKPMRTFLQRLGEAVDHALLQSQELNVAVIGSGAGGVEIACCLHPYLQNRNLTNYSIRIISAATEILPGASPGMRQRVLSFMEESNSKIELTTGQRVVEVTRSHVRLQNGTLITANVVIWATGAAAPAILSKFELPKDDHGFLLTDRTLRTMSGDPVFVVGDSGSVHECLFPKAGVFAVRQGPVLWENLQRLMRGQQLTEFVPQKSFMKLLNLGNGEAVGEWKSLSFRGRWVQRLKNYIDQRFMQMFRNLMTRSNSSVMQCRGCGCKLSSDVLRSALNQASTEQPGSTLRLADSLALDDGAEIHLSGGQTLIASTDFFTPPFSDHWLNGRIIAQHAMNDLFAMGATITGALATVVIPEGNSQSQQQILAELLTGISLELNAAGAKLNGGHTIVGPRCEVGLTVFGEPMSSQLIRKQNARPGDVLYLTRPLGTGILLAAHQQARCRADDFEELVRVMLQSQQLTAGIAVQCGVTAGTDITGFGLLGHLSEILVASNCAATLLLECVPQLDGAAALIREGVESSLTPANRQIEIPVMILAEHPNAATLALLYDPQTCGGLLLCVPDHLCQSFETALSAESAPQAIRIGQITSGSPRIDLV